MDAREWLDTWEIEDDRYKFLLLGEDIIRDLLTVNERLKEENTRLEILLGKTVERYEKEIATIPELYRKAEGELIAEVDSLRAQLTEAREEKRVGRLPRPRDTGGGMK